MFETLESDIFSLRKWSVKMATKFGTIQWKDQPDDTTRSGGHVPEFKKFCQECYPQKQKAAIDAEIDSFSCAIAAIGKQREKLAKEIANTSLLSAVVFWVEDTSQDKFLSLRNTTMMRELIKNEFIGIKDIHGNAWSLKQMVSIGHDAICEAIRCNDVWLLRKLKNM